MLKKSLPYLVVIIFLGWAIFKFFSARTAILAKPATAPLALDWDQVDANTNSKVQEVPETLRQGTAKGTASNSTPHSPAAIKSDKSFDMYDQVEQKWLDEGALIIGKKDYAAYLEMRKINEKEKLEAYRAYHESLKKKYGDKFTYNISEDQSPEERRINQSYLRRLLGLIGEEKFKRYLKARDKINEESRKNDKSFLLIEF